MGGEIARGHTQHHWELRIQPSSIEYYTWQFREVFSWFLKWPFTNTISHHPETLVDGRDYSWSFWGELKAEEPALQRYICAHNMFNFLKIRAVWVYITGNLVDAESSWNMENESREPAAFIKNDSSKKFWMRDWNRWLSWLTLSSKALKKSSSGLQSATLTDSCSQSTQEKLAPHCTFYKFPQSSRPKAQILLHKTMSWNGILRNARCRRPCMQCLLTASQTHRSERKAPPTLPATAAVSEWRMEWKSNVTE